MFYKGGFDSEVFVSVKVQVFLTKSILMEEFDRTIKSCFVNIDLP